MGGQSWITGHRCIPAESVSLFLPPGVWLSHEDFTKHS